MPFNPLDLLGAGLGAAGSIVSSAMQNAQSNKQMAFQERMSSTAHQREVADLRAAGLNPILGFTKGLGGASAPPGAQAQIENPMRNVSADYSAVQGARISREQLELQSKLNEAQLADIAAGIKLKEANSFESVQRGNLAYNQSALAAMDADPDKWAQGLRNLQATEQVLRTQASLNTASAKKALWETQVRSPTDLWGKILSDTLEGKGGRFSIQDIFKRIWNGGTTEGAGGMSPAYGGAHSAKPKR